MNTFKRWILKLTTQIPAGNKLYAGPYQEGEAVYTYIPIGETMMRNGEFRYRFSPNAGNYTRVKGFFRQGLRVGPWQYIQKSPGLTYKIEAHFQNGSFNGSLVSLRDNDAISLHAALLVNIKENHFVDRFVANIGGTDFSGYCDKDGTPIGQWFISDKKDASNPEGKKIDATSPEIAHLLQLAYQEVNTLAYYLSNI